MLIVETPLVYSSRLAPGIPTSVLVVKPLPVVAVFFAAVSVHYQIPIYLTYATALTIVAILSLIEVPRQKAFTAAIGAFLCIAGLALHAAQPVSRGLSGILLGKHTDLAAREGLPRARIAMERADQELYADLLDLIARNSAPSDRQV